MASLMRRSARGAERKKWQDPDVILKETGLKSGDTFVDIGCGEGYFAIPAASIVGSTGRVYAVDISPFVIDALEENARAAGLENITARVGLAERTVVCEACADFVFYGIVMHDFHDRNAVLRNARRMIKPGGKLIDLDFKKTDMPFGPPTNIKITEDEAIKLVEATGFQAESIKEIPPYSYFLVARPA